MKYLFWLSFIFALAFPSFALVERSGPCDDWVQVNDVKCLKVMGRSLQTFEEAKNNCKERKNGTLFIIESEEEQNFLVKQIYETENVANDFWIGLKMNSQKKFQWIDGKELTYTNWANGYPTGKQEEACVQVNHAENNKMDHLAKARGKWSNEFCSRKNIVVCQKSPDWSLQELSDLFIKFKGQTIAQNKKFTAEIDQLKSFKNEANNKNEELKNELKLTNNKLKNTTRDLDVMQANPVPIGFIYVQLPSQPAPADIWPKVTWQDVSASYAGDFFRVIGGTAAAFGVKQKDCSPRIVAAKTWKRTTKTNEITEKPLFAENAGVTSVYTTGNPLWTGPSGDITGKEPRDLEFKLSVCEVRPQNQAVRVWKRSK